MFKRRIYYTLKPFLPWRARNALRRMTVRKIREASQATWPIDEATARPPEGWPGWPEDKKFAFVLTHDVEGPKGVAKCRRLAELEMAHGFRSSYNLIPEGTYSVPARLRAWLTEEGFEVGVHDFNHDGKLYLSRSIFRKKGKRINHYLKEWGAVGFRSGFMLRELDWIHDLNISYDASTFDTDPFEPQPDAAGTIFPFWIPPLDDGLGRDGYVELPYTLAQDSTLFLVLREKSPDIWIRKLDWVARHGGMALVNVHPDYLQFPGEPVRPNTTPVENYLKLLEHVRNHYSGNYWQPLPKTLAAWFKGTLPAGGGAARAAESRRRAATDRSAALRGKRAAVLLYSVYPSDSRAFRAADAMVEAGMTVDLLCLQDESSTLREEIVGGVRVFRLPIKHARAGKLTYLRNYGAFLAASFAFIARRGFRQRYDIVHVHNMPDILVFSALPAKLRGAKVILDLHDPMPELMMTIFGLAADRRIVRTLRFLERLSIGFADLVLTPNIAFWNLFTSRSCPPDKIKIVMNSPRQDVFDPDRFHSDRRKARNPGEFRIMHHGLLVHRHGIDLLVEAVALIRPKIPGIRLDIYGSATPFLDTVFDLARRLGVTDILHHHGERSIEEIAEAIDRCDLGVVPNRRSAFTEINFPTRLFEYLALRRPVVAPATQGISDYFSSEEMVMFEPDNMQDLAAKMLWVWENPETTRAMVERGAQVYRENLWEAEKARFVDSVAALVVAR